MRIAVAAVLFLAGPAAAQELSFDPAPVIACLEDSGFAADCVGRAADVCQSQPGGYSTVGMSFCFGSEWEFWDDRLNEIYAVLMAQERARDAEIGGSTYTPPALAPALRDMQRAWIEYRDALCDYERAQWGGGTGQRPATAACLMAETARQAMIIKARLVETEAQ